MFRIVAVKSILHPSRSATLTRPGLRLSGSSLCLALLSAVLVSGCASRHYEVQLTNGMLIRTPNKPKLQPDGFYLVQDDAGQSGTINKALVKQIVEVRDTKTKSDEERIKSSASSKSAKPSGKPNFRNSFEFR